MRGMLSSVFEWTRQWHAQHDWMRIQTTDCNAAHLRHYNYIQFIWNCGTILWCESSFVLFMNALTVVLQGICLDYKKMGHAHKLALQNLVYGQGYPLGSRSEQGSRSVFLTEKQIQSIREFLRPFYMPFRTMLIALFFFFLITTLDM